MLLLVQAHPDLTHRQALRLCCVPRGNIVADFGAQTQMQLVLNLALIPAEAMGDHRGPEVPLMLFQTAESPGDICTDPADVTQD